jgi:non-specific serine/threonine protein kinase
MSSLPARRVTLVGRDHEVSIARHELLQTAGRLLTLTGTGGVGKTQLALEVASGLRPAFPDGVWLVELAPLAEPGLLAQSVAQALHLRGHSPRSPLERVLGHLRHRALLLVVDNCEHLVEACALFLDAVLAECPGVRVLATSRERLRIPGELTYRVPSLAAPDPAHLPELPQLGEYPSVRLFVDRARAVERGFALGAGNAPAVARLCAGLGGIPLALELAAARVSTLTVEQMAERLDDVAHLLVGGSRTAPSRHQRLWATLEWSFLLLNPREQRLFERLAVFAGGFALDAAQLVCAGAGATDEVRPSAVLDLLGDLVDKSLVSSSEAEGRTRFRLLEPVRQFAQRKLDATGGAAAARARHAAYFLRLAEVAQSELLKADQARWFDRVERDLDNVRAVLEWSRSAPDRLETGLRLAGALWRFWDGRGHLGEGRAWLDRLLGQAPSTATVGRARALFAAGWLAAMQDSDEAARPFAEQSVAAWRQLDDWRGLAWGLWLSGLVQRHSEPQAGLRAAEQGLELIQGRDDPTLLAWMLWLLGELARTSGDEDGAVPFFEQALTHLRGMEDPVGTSYALRSLGQVAGRRGDYPKATAYLRERLVLSRRVEDQWNLPDALEGLAWLAGAQRRAERAARLYGAAEAVREAQGMLLSDDRRARRELRARSLCEALGEVRFAAAWAAGRAMSLDQAIACALDEPSPADGGAGPVPTPARWPGIAAARGLTEREREVAGLVGQGLSTRAIAARLVIADGTAKVHVARILGKLELHSRAQLAAWVVRHELLPPEP